MLHERLELRRDEDGSANLDDVVGPLERRVLECLWRRGEDATVRDLQGEFSGTAYTTLMTTLDRLFRKGVLERVKDGRAFRYHARFTRDELVAEAARRVLARMLSRGDQAGLRPVLSTLIDAVSEQDAGALDELERLVRERRASDRDKGGAA